MRDHRKKMPLLSSVLSLMLLLLVAFAAVAASLRLSLVIVLALLRMESSLTTGAVLENEGFSILEAIGDLYSLETTVWFSNRFSN